MTTAQAAPDVAHRLTVALGSRTYGIRRPWGDLPVGGGTVTDVAVDGRGHVFVLLRRDLLTDACGPAIVEMSPQGTRLKEWGGDQIVDGHKMGFSPEGLLYVVDRDAHHVSIWSSDGAAIGTLGVRGRPNAPFNHPCDVAFGSEGRVFVCDGYANSRIHCFTADGSLSHSWGRRGNAPGDFLSPHAIIALPERRLAVCDRDNHRVQIFTEEGELLDIWSGFHRPTAFCVHPDGELYVMDQVPSLTRFSADGREVGRCRPVLNGAHGVAMDPSSGRLYFAESNPSRISALDLCVDAG